MKSTEKARNTKSARYKTDVDFNEHAVRYVCAQAELALAHGGTNHIRHDMQSWTILARQNEQLLKNMADYYTLQYL